MITKQKGLTAEVKAAMDTLAAAYGDQWTDLVATYERQRKEAAATERLPRSDQQDGPVYDLEGEAITDADGVVLSRGMRVILKDGVHGDLLRLDRRTRRAVVKRDDSGKVVAAVSHGLHAEPEPPTVPKRGRPRKNA